MRKNERGSNLLELALVIPLLLLMMAAIADFGRAFYSYIGVTNAAREGARTASRLYCDPASGTQRTQYLSRIRTATILEAANYQILLNNGNITITPNPATGCAISDPANNINQSVTVRVDYSINTLLGGIIGRGTIPMQTSTTMIKFGL
jgi:Flp pilus assembly protein TadG